jgi:hypothetical protein
MLKIYALKEYKEERIAVAEGLLKNADNSRRLLISAYLELAEKK